MSKEKETVVLMYEESELPVAFSNRVTQKLSKVVLEDKVCTINAKVNIIALAKAAGERKSKESPVATVIDDLEGNLLLGCIVQYIPEETGKKKEDEEEKTAGSWRCDFTFNQEDIPENCRVVKLSERKMDTIFIQEAATLSFRYKSDSYIYVLAEVFASTLREFLENSAKEDKIIEVELSNYFTASVEVEDGKMVLSFTPSGATVKRAVKSDLDLVED